MGYDIFVSYSTQDKLFADAMVNKLENEKIRCWYAPRDIPPGVAWPSAIAAAIKQTPVMLLIFSSSANRSEEVSRELTLASNNKCVVIPVRIENVLPSQELEYHLTNRHWLDVYDLELEAAIAQVMEVVQSYSGTLRGEPGGPGGSADGSAGGTLRSTGSSGRLAGDLSRRRLLRRWLPVFALLGALGLGAFFMAGRDSAPPLQVAKDAPVYYYKSQDGRVEVRTLLLESGLEPEHLVWINGLPDGREGNGVFHCAQSLNGEEFIFSALVKGKKQIIFRVNYGNGFVYDQDAGRNVWVSYTRESKEASGIREMLDAWEKQGKKPR